MDVTAELIEELRVRIGERIPEGGADTDTLFTDAELTVLLDQVADITAGTALGWEFKAAELARLVDVAEADSTRYLSQRWKHAKSMADKWTKKVDDAAALRTAVTGVAIDILRPNSDEHPVEPSGFHL